MTLLITYRLLRGRRLALSVIDAIHQPNVTGWVVLIMVVSSIEFLVLPYVLETVDAVVDNFADCKLQALECCTAHESRELRFLNCHIGTADDICGQVAVMVSQE